jgi:hypothetical protein
VPITQSYVSVLLWKTSFHSNWQDLTISGRMVGSFQEMDMTETKEHRSLKSLAKLYARAKRIAQHQTLDQIAGELGFHHWTKLIGASKKGWQADKEQMKRVEAFVTRALPEAFVRTGDPEAMNRCFAYLEQAEHGMIGDCSHACAGPAGDHGDGR